MVTWSALAKLSGVTMNVAPTVDGWLKPAVIKVLDGKISREKGGWGMKKRRNKTIAIGGNTRPCVSRWHMLSQFKYSILPTTCSREMAKESREQNWTMLAKTTQDTSDTAAFGLISTAKGEESGPPEASAFLASRQWLQPQTSFAKSAVRKQN